MVEFNKEVNVILGWDGDEGKYSGREEVELDNGCLVTFDLFVSVVGKTINYGYMHEPEWAVLSFDIFVNNIEVFDVDNNSLPLSLAEFKKLEEDIKNNVTYE